MILGAHVIMGFYGFWLPNDPRGSWSDFVAAWELFRFGGPTRSVWARRQWIAFLDCSEDSLGSIRYVRDNPVREGLRPQHWACVSPYGPDSV